MLKDFNRDREAAKPAEELVYNLLSSLGYDCKNVADDRESYFKGDIRI